MTLVTWRRSEPVGKGSYSTEWFKKIVLVLEPLLVRLSPFQVRRARISIDPSASPPENVLGRQLDDNYSYAENGAQHAVRPQRVNNNELGTASNGSLSRINPLSEPDNIVRPLGAPKGLSHDLSCDARPLLRLRLNRTTAKERISPGKL